MILSCQNITKSFGTDVILSDVSFHINDHEKAAIVGINGAGKSTILKIIPGELMPDSGQVVPAKGATIGYLSQQQDLVGENTIYDEVMSVKAGIIAIEQNIRRLEREMKNASGEELEAMLNSYTRLTQNELALQFYQLGFFSQKQADQALACMSMMEFEGKDELMQQLAYNGTMQRELALYQQYALALTEKYEPMNAPALMASITGDRSLAATKNMAAPAMGEAMPPVEAARAQSRELSLPGGKRA